MGQKVNPIGFRLAVRRDWKSRWCVKGRDFSRMVIQDAEARRFIEKKYTGANISKIIIERTEKIVRLIIHSGRPGVLIGKKGEGIENLRRQMAKMFKENKISVDVTEVKSPETDAKLVALNIAQQLENRVMFRRAMRRAMGNATRLKVEGIKIMLAGRLNGIEIARTEWHREGRIPLHTLKNDIDFGQAEAHTEMGVVGVKVWISKGDTYGRAKKVKYTAGEETTTAASAPAAAETKPDETAPAAEAKPAESAENKAEEKVNDKAAGASANKPTRAEQQGDDDAAAGEK